MTRQPVNTKPPRRERHSELSRSRPHTPIMPCSSSSLTSWAGRLPFTDFSGNAWAHIVVASDDATELPACFCSKLHVDDVKVQWDAMCATASPSIQLPRVHDYQR